MPVVTLEKKSRKGSVAAFVGVLAVLALVIVLENTLDPNKNIIVFTALKKGAVYALELVVGHFCVFVVEREHGFLERLDALELLFAVVAEQLCEYIHMLNTVLSSGCAHSKIMRFGIFRIHIHFSIARAAGKKQESARIFIKTSRKAKLRFTQNRPIAGPPAGRGHTVQGMNRAAGGRRAPGGTGLPRMRRGA